MTNRDFYINDVTLVKVKGGAHTALFASGNISSASELGLASEAIRVSPKFHQEDIYIDDFGTRVPNDLMSNMSEVNIRIPFVHFDHNIMDACWAESTGGIALDPNPANQTFSGIPNAFRRTAGILAPTGTLQGGWADIFESGCHYISLNLVPGISGTLPWRFPFSVLTGAQEFPLGTEASVVVTNWRAIPYVIPDFGTNPDGTISVSEIISSGAVLWDNLEDS